MNAFRKIGLVVLIALVAVFALSLLESSAVAGGHHGHGHHHHGHFHVKYLDYGAYWPTYQYVKPISYPVTYYDCYGRPYVVWQTSYNTNPVW
jgi:hypothetical protein